MDLWEKETSDPSLPSTSLLQSQKPHPTPAGPMREKTRKLSGTNMETSGTTGCQNQSESDLNWLKQIFARCFSASDSLDKSDSSKRSGYCSNSSTSYQSLISSALLPTLVLVCLVLSSISSIRSFRLESRLEMLESRLDSLDGVNPDLLNNILQYKEVS